MLMLCHSESGGDRPERYLRLLADSNTGRPARRSGKMRLHLAKSTLTSLMGHVDEVPVEHLSVDPDSEKRRRLRILGIFWICALRVVPAVLVFAGSVIVGHRAAKSKEAIGAYLHAHDVRAVDASQLHLITGGRMSGDPLPGASEVSAFGDGGVRLREEVRWPVSVRWVECTETASDPGGSSQRGVSRLT
jgi:hypothetical protein